MVFDLELCFINEGQLTAFTGGVVGGPLDLGADNQTGKGRPSYVAISCGDQDMTATGDPEIVLALQMADKEDFSDMVQVPLSLPPLKKEDFAAGLAVVALAPMYAKRYVQLFMATSSELACSTITAGFVLDPQTRA